MIKKIDMYHALTYSGKPVVMPIDDFSRFELTSDVESLTMGPFGSSPYHYVKDLKITAISRVLIQEGRTTSEQAEKMLVNDLHAKLYGDLLEDLVRLRHHSERQTREYITGALDKLIDKVRGES